MKRYYPVVALSLLMVVVMVVLGRVHHAYRSCREGAVVSGQGDAWNDAPDRCR